MFQLIIKDALLEGKLAIHSLPHTSLVKTLPGSESTLQPGHNICIARSPAFSIHSQQQRANCLFIPHMSLSIHSVSQFILIP